MLRETASICCGEYPKKLNELLQDGLAKKKEDRPSSMRDYKERFLKALKKKTKVAVPAAMEEDTSNVEQQQALAGSYHVSVRSRPTDRVNKKDNKSGPADSIIRSPQVRERGQLGSARA
ncbi:MAG: hypothetical protein AAF446_05570, partial [Pseudomonadota bacterium]